MKKLISTFFLSIMFAATSIGATPPLPHPEEFVGNWVVFDAWRFCNIHLGIEEVPQANGFRVTIDPRIGACNFSLHVTAWRPASDGISLLDSEGATLIFFSQEAQGYRSNIAGESGMRLRRESAAD